MDASAFIEHPQWLELLKKLNLQEESMCEGGIHKPRGRIFGYF